MSFPQGHALLIGVGSHQFVPQFNVPITKADAAAVAAILCDPNTCGYPATQVKFIHDEGATKAGILAELDALAQRTKEKDTVFIFYAGHGALGTDGNYYFVCHDAQIQKGRVVATTGVSEGELLAKLRALKAQRVLMIFNACFAGNLSQSLDLPLDLASDPALEPEPEALAISSLSEATAAALLGSGQGRIIITACGEEQLSSFFKNDANTIFTKALLNGLGGKGEVRNTNGFISAFSLYEHVYTAVSEIAHTKLSKKQEPELTVLKGVGPFAVALYNGAATLGDFDDSEPLPQGMAVREVRPEKSARIFNQRLTQTGGVNLGQGNKIKVTGDVFSGDKITTGDISGSSGIAIGRGAQAHVHTNAARITPDQFNALLKQLRAELATAQLDSDERAAVQQDIAAVEAQVAKAEPKLSLIKRGLNNVKEVIEAAAGVGAAGLALSGLVQRTIDMAQQLFR